MYFIYGIVNTINEKWYVGQTTRSVDYRYRQHICSSKNPNSNEYDFPFGRALRKYGEDSFELHILEEVQNAKDLDKKERKWIKIKRSFIRDNGYNCTSGGQFDRGHIEKVYKDSRQVFTSEKTIEKIISEIMYGEINLTQIAKKYDVSVALISLINTGDKYRRKGLSYPLREFRRYPTKEEIKTIIKLLKKGYSNIAIAEKVCVCSDVVYRINYGHAHKIESESYPIRKGESEKEIRASKIKSLLEDGDLNNKQIAKKVGIDPSSVSRINSGKIYREEDRIYPIR